MEWLDRLKRRFSPDTTLTVDNAPVIMPDKTFQTTEYLYHAGFFGEGSAADARLNQAAHLVVAEHAFRGWPSYNVQDALNSLNALLAETGLDTSAPKQAERLRQLVANPPSVDDAMQLAAKTGGILDDALWLTRRGNMRAAAQAWTDITATQQVLRAIAAYDSAKKAESEGHITKAQHMRHIAGMPVQYADMVGESGLGHVLQSAIYNLDHPEQFRATLRDQKELLQQAYVLNTELKPQGRSVSLGDMLAGSSLLVGPTGDVLGRDATRMAMDAALLQKQADRMRLVAMAVPAELYNPQQLQGDDLRQYLLLTSDKLLDITEKLDKTSQKFNEHRIGGQQFANVLDELGGMLTQQRQARAVLSNRAHELAEQVWNLAHDQNTPPELLQSAARNLTQLRDAASGMAAAADVVHLQAIDKIGKQGDMNLNNRLATTQQLLVQTASSIYPAELLQHFQSSAQAPQAYQQGVLNALINGPQKAAAGNVSPQTDATLEEMDRTSPGYNGDHHDKNIPANAQEAALQSELTGALPQAAAHEREAGIDVLAK